VAVDDAKTWDLIHAERAAMVETLAALPPEQWAVASLVSGWSVHAAAGPEISGPGLSLLLAMTGRPAGLAQLTGTGLDTLRSRVAPAA
jgi:hypothetical protein